MARQVVAESVNKVLWVLRGTPRKALIFCENLVYVQWLMLTFLAGALKLNK